MAAQQFNACADGGLSQLHLADVLLRQKNIRTGERIAFAAGKPSGFVYDVQFQQYRDQIEKPGAAEPDSRRVIHSREKYGAVSLSDVVDRAGCAAHAAGYLRALKGRTCRR